MDTVTYAAISANIARVDVEGSQVRATAGVDYSQASREAAIVAAFDAVKAQFAWDAARGAFVAGPAAARHGA